MSYDARPAATRFGNKLRDLIEEQRSAPMDDRLSIGEIVGALHERAYLLLLGVHAEEGGCKHERTQVTMMTNGNTITCLSCGASWAEEA